MNRIFKSFLFIFAILINFDIVYASEYVIFNKGGINNNLKPVYGVEDDYYLQKTEWTVQRLYLKYAKTNLTDPCTSCTYIIKPYETTIGYRAGSTVQMGNTIDLNNSSVPGYYAIYGRRVETSILNNVITGYWWVD